jgi:hypothetical protein
MFRPGLFSGPTIYSDLDAMLLGNVDEFAGPWDSHVMIEDYYPWIDNSTLMYFDASDPIYAEIYQNMLDDEHSIKERYAWKGRGKSHGDQELISDHLISKGRQILRWQKLLGREKFLKFSGGADRVTVHVDDWTDSSPAIYAYCMGKPKFHHVPHLPMVQKHWV